jgi:hypothetical protein
MSENAFISLNPSEQIHDIYREFDCEIFVLVIENESLIGCILPACQPPPSIPL